MWNIRKKLESILNILKISASLEKNNLLNSGMFQVSVINIFWTKYLKWSD